MCWAAAVLSAAGRFSDRVSGVGSCSCCCWQTVQHGSKQRNECTAKHWLTQGWLCPSAGGHDAVTHFCSCWWVCSSSCSCFESSGAVRVALVPTQLTADSTLQRKAPLKVSAGSSDGRSQACRSGIIGLQCTDAAASPAVSVPTATSSLGQSTSQSSAATHHIQPPSGRTGHYGSTESTNCPELGWSIDRSRHHAPPPGAAAAAAGASPTHTARQSAR